MYKIAFVGNPNVGKSSLINSITNSNEFTVGNWSGVTVDEKHIKLSYFSHKYNQKYDLELHDLPGIYDLNAKSIDEKITVNTIEENKYDLYINVLDSTNLERNLYLTLLLKELNLPLLIVLNQYDKTEKLNHIIQINRLSKILACPVLVSSALKKTGLNTIIETVCDYIEQKKANIQIKPFYVYENKLEEIIKLIEKDLNNQNFHKIHGSDNFTNKFYSLKLIEKNEHYIKHLKIEKIDLKNIQKLIKNFELSYSKDIASFLVEKRQKYLFQLITAVLPNGTNEKKLKNTLRIDKILLNKHFGIPIFLIIFLLFFILVFNISTPFKNFLDFTINNWIGNGLDNFLNGKTPNWLNSLLLNGIIGGVGTILTFLPVFFCLYFLLGIMQETGYMSRVSFLLSGIFNKIGLSGKSLVPLLLGFGCNVTSIYSSRIISNPNKRKITALMAPFMSCNARLPIFALFSLSFFSKSAGLVIFSLYIMGIIFAIILALIAKLFYKSNSLQDDSLNDLPNYHLPSIKVLLKTSAINMRSYLKKASTLILFFSILIWIISYFPYGDSRPDDSILAWISKNIFSPLFWPLGFSGIWQLVASIFPAIIAKEITISSLGVLAHIQTNTDIANIKDVGMNFLLAFKNALYGISPTNWLVNFTNTDSQDTINSLSAWLNNNILFSGPVGHLRAYSYMMFMLLTIPCVTTLASIRQEFGNKFMFLSISIGIVVPYLSTMLFFQIFHLFIK